MMNIYATFWLRVAAFIIDTSLIALFFYISKDILLNSIGLEWVGLIHNLVFWLYFSLFHSSSWKATPGGKFVDIQVVDYDGKRISFVRASMRFLASFISTILLLPYLTVVFTKKKQTIHDLLVKTVVIDVAASRTNALYNSENLKQEESIHKSKSPLNRKLAYLFVTLFIGVLLYTLYSAIAMVTVYSALYSQKEAAYNKSFHTDYTEKEYRDPRINFYKQELEKSYEGYVKADGLVNMFEYDTKIDLSLDCVEYYIKDHNETDWIEEGSRIRKNARNKAANTDKLIDKAKANAHEIQLHFYLYDLNLVNDTISDLSNLWHDKSKRSLCDQNLSAEQLYDVFLTNYLAQYIENHVSSKHRRLSPSDNRDFLKRKQKEEESWLTQITKSSPLEIYKQFSLGNITLEGIAKEHNFRASIATYDVVLENEELIVADGKRGIELWKRENASEVTFLKTLTNNYKVHRIQRLGNLLFVAAHGKKKNSYFLIFAYDEKTKTLKELDKVKIALYSKIQDWSFFNNGNKVAVVYGYDKMALLDLSEPQNIKIIFKRSDRSNNYSIDIAVNEETNTLYELTKKGLNIFDIKNNLISKIRMDRSFKGYKGLIIDKKEKALYTLNITWRNGSFFLEYNLDDPYNPKFISSKAIDIDLFVRDGKLFAHPEKMKIYKNKFYIPTINKICVLDRKMNVVRIIDAPGIKQFYFLENKILCACGKNGLLLIDQL